MCLQTCFNLQEYIKEIPFDLNELTYLTQVDTNTSSQFCEHVIRLDFSFILKAMPYFTFFFFYLTACDKF